MGEISSLLPSFEDIRRYFQFWFDQQDKWFYFETHPTDYGETSSSHKPGGYMGRHGSSSYTSTIPKRFQERIVGRISDIVPSPPSLMSIDGEIRTVRIKPPRRPEKEIIPVVELVESREPVKFGLVFSRITYYEPIKNSEIDKFKESDPRWNLESV